MKKYIITVMIALGFIMNASAQSDGFFNYSNTEERNTTWMGGAPNLPSSHGNTNDQSVPLGGGLFILTALGIVYNKTRRDASM